MLLLRSTAAGIHAILWTVSLTIPPTVLLAVRGSCRYDGVGAGLVADVCHDHVSCERACPYVARMPSLEVPCI